MKERIKNMKIRTKILLVYVLILCFSIVVSTAVFGAINERYTEEQVSEASVQTVDALKGNLSIMFENVEQFTNLIYFDKDVQKALDRTETIAVDPVINRTIQGSLVNMLLSANYIESVFIFDKYNNNYSSKKIAPVSVNGDLIPETDWYKSVDEANGETIYVNDMEGVLAYPTRLEHRAISLARAINSDADYRRLALLVVNINEETIVSFFDDVSSEYGTNYCIMNAKGEFIVHPTEDLGEKTQLLKKFVTTTEGTDKNYEIVKTANEKCCFVKSCLGIEDWYIVGTVPMIGNQPMGSYQKSLVLLLVLLNIFVVVICSMSLVRLIFNPLSEVVKHMAQVENAVFLPISIEEQGNNEIICLKRGFNSMVFAIEELLEKVKKEEKEVARNEFEILQAQIKPHFLYNTLDAISALVLTKQYENCFKMTQALGQFYRNSLNSGKQIVTVQDELDCVENYVTILNIRYDNKIRLICDVQEDILQCHMLKLVLQPIVENAVYHGIRCRNGEGTIRITGYRYEEEIILMVSDDGVGMPEEKIEEIMSGNSKKDKSGFGLYSEIQRLSLFYDVKKPINITSELDSGTEITIYLKEIG